MADRPTSVRQSGDAKPPHHETRSRARGAAGAVSDPQAIARRIEHTRSELSATLAAIADRLSPERLAGETMAATTEAVEEVSKAAEKAATEALDEATAEMRKMTK